MSAAEVASAVHAFRATASTCNLAEQENSNEGNVGGSKESHDPLYQPPHTLATLARWLPPVRVKSRQLADEGRRHAEQADPDTDGRAGRGAHGMFLGRPSVLTFATATAK